MADGLPNLPSLQGLGDWLSSPTPASNVGQTDASKSGWFGSNNPLSQSLAGIQSSVQNLFSGLGGSNSASDKSSLSWSRVAAFTVGILLIGGGILMFKQTQTVIQTGVRAGRRAAEIAAL